MSAARPWRLLGAADLAAARRGLEPLATAWAHTWLPGETVAIGLAPAQAGAERREPLLALCDGDDARTGPRQAVLYGAAHRLLRPALAEAGSELAVLMARYILRDLLARLARLPAGGLRDDARFSMPPDPLPGALAADGSVVLTLGLGREELAVWISHALLGPWLERAGRGDARPLASRQDALAGRRLGLRVLAGQAELGLADLVRLEPGDVVLLDTRADRPMVLESSQGTAIAHGYLGLRDNATAMQICK